MSFNVSGHPGFPPGWQRSPLVMIYQIIPRFDLQFNQIQPKFNYKDQQYVESLIVIAVLPCLWLILNLFLFLLFFMCRCCSKDWKKTKRMAKTRCFLVLIGLLTLGSIGAGFYGNEITHLGFTSLSAQFQNITDTIATVTNKVNADFTGGVVNRDMSSYLDDMRNSIKHYVTNTNEKNVLNDYVNDMESKYKGAVDTATAIIAFFATNQFNSTSRVAKLQMAESYRLPYTMGYLGVFTFVCLLLLLGVCKRSRKTLILVSVLGLLSMIVNWALVSIYATASIGGSDLCNDPDSFFEQRLKAINPLSGEIGRYYIYCDRSGHNLAGQLIIAKERISDIHGDLNKIRAIAKSSKEIIETADRIDHSTTAIETSLEQAVELSHCEYLNSIYNQMITSTCYTLIDGVSMLLLSALLCGLFFNLIIFMASKAWIIMHKKRKNEYQEVDGHDPFMMNPNSLGLRPTAPTLRSSTSRSASSAEYGYGIIAGGTTNNSGDRYRATHRPSAQHTPPHTPPFHNAYSNGKARADWHSPLHGRYTPPPSYEQLGGGLIKA